MPWLGTGLKLDCGLICRFGLGLVLVLVLVLGLGLWLGLELNPAVRWVASPWRQQGARAAPQWVKPSSMMEATLGLSALRRPRPRCGPFFRSPPSLCSRWGHRGHAGRGGGD